MILLIFYILWVIFRKKSAGAPRWCDILSPLFFQGTATNAPSQPAPWELAAPCITSQIRKCFTGEKNFQIGKTSICKASFWCFHPSENSLHIEYGILECFRAIGCKLVPFCWTITITGLVFRPPPVLAEAPPSCVLPLRPHKLRCSSPTWWPLDADLSPICNKNIGLHSNMIHMLCSFI